MCLSQSSRCNQIIECDDWSDELNCGNTGIFYTHTHTHTHTHTSV